MGPFGVGELLIIFLVILLIFGAKKLPELARGLGKGINDFKDAASRFSISNSGKRGGEIGWI